MEQIWEGSKYKIKASVVDHSTPYTGKVDLYVLKNHDQSQPIQTEKGISVKAGKPIVRTFDVPKVDPKVANYDFSVIAKYGDAMGKSQQLADAKVWPKEVTIHVTNKLDGDKDFKDVKLLIQQGGKAVAKLVTDASGKCEVELPLKAPYAILARPPYQIIKNVRDAANTRHHEIQAERRIVAKFVKPDVTKSPPWVANAAANTELNRKAAVRLWVNQKSKKADAAEAKGNVIEFEVSADPKDVGKKGDKVFVQVNFSKDSKRNDPKPELLNNPAVTDLNESANKKVYTGYVTLDKDGGTAKFKVNTGLAGGDSCLVSIGGRKSPPFDQSRKFVNWRKLWYELRYPTLLKPKLNKGDYAILLKTAITGKLARTFIVLEKSKSHEFPNANATFAKKNGMIMPKAFFQDGAGSIYVVTNGWLDTTNKFSGDAKTRNQTIYVSLCERAFSSNVQTIAPVQVVKSDDFDLPLPADAYVFKKRPDNGADNVTVAAGHKWKAVIAGAQLHATTWDAGAPSAAGAVAGKVTLAEARRAGKTVTVSFAAKAGGKFDTTLSATETAKVEAFVTDLLSSDPDLRDVGNQVTLHVTSRTADADDAARATAALGVAKAKFDAVAKTVKYHPGLDRNGAPREGAMNVAWVTVKDYVTFNVKLPKSAHGVADYKKILPGDFVGAAESATECPVKVQFSYCSGGEINGNSGSGSQIMVLRAAATADALSETVCHELGHAMGMTIVPGLNNDLLPPGLATQHVDSGKQSYVNGPAPYNFTDGKREIHKGGHCAFNLPAAKRADKRFLGWSPDAATPGCIMWGSGDNVATRANYCDECGKLIKARRLDDIITAFAGRGANDG